MKEGKHDFMSSIPGSIIGYFATTCLFAFCPISPMGIAIAFGSVLVGGFIIEYSTQWIAVQKPDFITTFARQIPKSIGAGIYIALSYIAMPSLFLVPILSLIVLVIGTNYFFDVAQTGLDPAFFFSSCFYGLSIWLASGYHGNLIILGLVIAALISTLICIDSKTRKWHWGTLAFGFIVSLGFHIFGVLSPALTIYTIILFQVMSFLSLFPSDF